MEQDNSPLAGIAGAMPSLILHMTDKPPETYRNAEAFKAARQALKMSQTQFGEALGLSSKDRAVRRLESGEREISLPLARLVWFLVKYGVPKIFKHSESKTPSA